LRLGLTCSDLFPAIHPRVANRKGADHRDEPGGDQAHRKDAELAATEGMTDPGQRT